MLLHHNYTYRASLEASIKTNWEVEDLIGAHKKLDFSKPFLPESLARVQSFAFLSDREKLLLNQIRGNSYLHIFRFVEEFILPFVLEYTRSRVHDDIYEVRALLKFVEEEGKHIQLFQEFAKAFAAGFGSPCQAIGAIDRFAESILKKSPLGVVLAILQIEWMTQSHYLGSIRYNRELDPLFVSLLQHHWIEEAQHAKLDTLMAEDIADRASMKQIDRGIEDYLAIVSAIEAGLVKQVEFDIVALERAVDRSFLDRERQELRLIQQAAYRYTFLTSGMSHPNFMGTLERIGRRGSHRVAHRVIDRVKMLA
jgi:hypothetical protein